MAYKKNKPGRIETTGEALADNDILLANAMQDSNKGINKILDLAGSKALSIGLQKMMGGAGPEGINLDGAQLEALPASTQMDGVIAAMGGQIPQNAEVEGEEVGEGPNGSLMDFQGPSHGQGGIDINLPGGTEMYSKRIKVDGVSMAKRKKKRNNSEVTLEKLFQEDDTDQILGRTLDRVEKNNAKEDQRDKMTQTLVRTLMKKKGIKFDEGEKDSKKTGKVKGKKFKNLPTKAALRTAKEAANKMGKDLDLNDMGSIKDFQKALGMEKSNGKYGKETHLAAKKYAGGGTIGQKGPTIGDVVGTLGTLKSAFSPLETTLENRAGDDPNINYYEDYGQEGLDKIDQAKQFVGDQKDDQLRNLDLNKKSAISKNRNTASSVNTMRALDTATQNSTNRQERKVYNNANNKLMQLLEMEAQMENDQDQVVMTGDKERDLNDRRDRDAFFTNLAASRDAIGSGLQELGKNLNAQKAANDTNEIYNQLIESGMSENKARLVAQAIAETTRNTPKTEE